MGGLETETAGLPRRARHPQAFRRRSRTPRRLPRRRARSDPLARRRERRGKVDVREARRRLSRPGRRARSLIDGLAASGSGRPGDALRAGDHRSSARSATSSRSGRVLDNVFLGREGRVARARPATGDPEALRGALRGDRASRSPRTRASGWLRVSEQLQVEILRALARDARLVVIDEVTAALTAHESERLFDRDPDTAATRAGRSSTSRTSSTRCSRSPTR